MYNFTDGELGSSPHTRGARALRARSQGPLRIIPAYAGSTFRGTGGNVPYADHPRIRGEHPFLAASQAADSGSSPHTRGAPTTPSVPPRA